MVMGSSEGRIVFYTEMTDHWSIKASGKMTSLMEKESTASKMAMLIMEIMMMAIITVLASLLANVEQFIMVSGIAAKGLDSLIFMM